MAFIDPDDWALIDTAHRMRDPYTFRSSYPGGKRFTVCDGSGYDDDVVDIFDTKEEAAAAVKVLNTIRDDVLPILDAAIEAIKPAAAQPAPDAHLAPEDHGHGDGRLWCDPCVAHGAALEQATHRCANPVSSGNGIDWHCASCTGESFDRDDPECHGALLAAAQPASDALREAFRMELASDPHLTNTGRILAAFDRALALSNPESGAQVDDGRLP